MFTYLTHMLMCTGAQYHVCHVLFCVYTGCQYWECYAAARKSRWGVFVWFSEWFSQYCSSISVSSLSRCCLYLLTLHTYKYMLYCALNVYSVVCMLNIPLLRTGGLVARILYECPQCAYGSLQFPNSPFMMLCL